MLNKILEKFKKAARQDKDIEDRDGTQPAKYYGKDAEGDEMSKSTKQDRARHFEKGAEKDDNDSSAYKPAPGDATAKTKPSQHTKKFKKMFGEDAQAAAKLKAKQADELERLKDKQTDELEALKDRHERQNETQKDKDTTEKENETLQKQRDAERKAAEKEREKAMESLLDTLDTLPDAEDSTHLSELEEGDADKSLESKASKTGIAVGILKQVYKRGVAAWRTGHRPGTTPEQWGHARVNSFITGGKTRTTADADLWKQHSGKKEEVTEKRLADILRDKEKSKQKAHQKAMMKSARDSIKKYEKDKKKSVNEVRAKQAVSQGKVQKLVTAHGLQFKGKKYDEIDMELKGINNNTKEVTFNIIHPKEIFGNEVKLTFNTLRRGPFMATDTSKINSEKKVEEERDYKKEYENYHSDPEQIKRRAKRNEARRLMKNNKDIKGKDVHHKDNNPMNNDKSNLSIVSQKFNRTEPRLRTEVLDKSATQQDYIDDFLKSDASQFKGKTKDKIIKMAVAAYNERNK